MRRLLVFLVLIAMVASACGRSEVVEINSGATQTTEAVVPESAEVESAVADEPTNSEPEAQVEPEPEVEAEVEAEPDALRTGREAILANHTEGKPYVLWYWGAH